MPGDWRIGVDVGGTKIAAGLVDAATGEVRHACRIPVRAARPPAEIIGDVAQLIEEVRAASGLDGTVPVGIGVPELVDRAGRIRSTWNFDLSALPDRIDAVVDSDVRVAARAEARFGAGRGLASFVYVTLSTGMSYTLCIAGEPWLGAHGFAIHFATTPLRLPGIEPVTVETMAGGLGMARRWQAPSDVTTGGVPEIERAAADGDGRARTILVEGARAAGSLIAQMVDMLDPGTIVLGGGLGLSDGLYRRALEATIRDTVWAEPLRAVPIVRASLGERAGLVGAALAARPA